MKLFFLFLPLVSVLLSVDPKEINFKLRTTGEPVCGSNTSIAIVRAYFHERMYHENGEDIFEFLYLHAVSLNMENVLIRFSSNLFPFKRSN